MKKAITVFGILITVLLTSFCCIALATSSTTFSSTPRIHYNASVYPGTVASMENGPDQMQLQLSSKRDGLRIPLSGEYKRIALSDLPAPVMNTISTTEYCMKYYDAAECWRQINVSDKTLYIIFFPYNRGLLYTKTINELEVIPFEYKYNLTTRSIWFITLNRSLTAAYRCYFSLSTFYELERSIPEKTETSAETVVERPNREQKTPQQEEKKSANVQKLVEGLTEFIKLPGFTIVFALILFFITILFIFCKYVKIESVYERDLRTQLFPRSHKWLKNNNPADIYISVRINSKDVPTRISLLEYFSNRLPNRPNRYVLLGNAGEGKTYSLSKIAMSIFDGYDYKYTDKAIFKKYKQMFPVIINYVDCERCIKYFDLIEVICNNIRNVISNNFFSGTHLGSLWIKRSVIKHLRDGTLVLMVDGYDEIVNQERRLIVSKALIGFMKYYQRCNYIITSRPNVYMSEHFNVIREDKILNLVPLTKEQINDFLHKLTYPENKSATKLFQHIMRSSQLDSITSNPLLLTMIAHTYCNDEMEIAGSRVGVYKQCCTCLLKTWEAEKARTLRKAVRFNLPKSLDEKEQLLMRTAFELYNNNVPAIPEQDLLEAWNQMKFVKQTIPISKKKLLVDNLIEQSCLLERVGENKIRFQHRSFFEYYVALYFFENGLDITALYNNLGEYRNILFFYMSICDNEYIPTSFMTEHKNDWQLCLDIMIERKLKNEEAVRTVVQRILKMLDYKDIKMMQSIGVLGGNYPTLTQMIIDAIADQLSDSDSPAPSNVVVAAMICLMSFNQVEMVSALLKKYIRIINIEEVVFYAQENLNDYGKDIIRLLKPATQQRFIQSLVKTNRYEAVYNIFLNVPSCRDLASVGLICFAHDDDVVNWLRIVRLEKHLNNSELEKAEQLGMQYPYPKEYKNNISTLFQLITIASNAILHGASPYISLIDHRISFLLCYIVSEQCGKIYNKLINGNGFTITSLVEFSYHWKRIAQQRKFSLFNGFVFSIPVLNNAIILLETGLVFSHAMIYIIYGRFLYELRSLGMEFRNSLLTDFSSYTFGTVYIIHYLLIFSLIAILNHLIHKFLSYNKNSIILSYIISGACAAYYISNTYNLLFRITMILCVICTAFFETLKHRNNYPSLKRPQFNRVISFLST